MLRSSRCLVPLAAAAWLASLSPRPPRPLPLSFEASGPGAFLARVNGHALRVTPAGASLGPLRMRLAGANRQARAAALDELPGKVHYFLGANPSRWRTNVSTYARVRYENVYPGVDLIYYGNRHELEYDLVVAEGADPRAIRLAFDGAAKLEVDRQGNLVIRTAAGPAVQRKAVAWRDWNGRRQKVNARYVLNDAGEAGFAVEGYDGRGSLVIDPVLVYSTFLGGSFGDEGTGIAVDAAGNAYVTGTTGSEDFPTTAGAFQTRLAGTRSAEAGDVFVTKLNAAGTAVLYSTFVGGSSGDRGMGIAVDGAGNAHVAGYTYSADFPVPPGSAPGSRGLHGFVFKLNAAGNALAYVTFAGGSGETIASSLALDASGNACVAGYTAAKDFPTTSGALQRSFGGGSTDFFVMKLTPGGALAYATYLGGSRSEESPAIAADAAGNAYVTGVTNSTDFPTTPGAFQRAFSGGAENHLGEAFVAKLNPSGSALVYSSYLGGQDVDWGAGIAVDASGNAYVTGLTQSSDFPTTPGAYRTVLRTLDATFASKLNAAGTALAYSTLLDPGSPSIALDAEGGAYLAGFDHALAARLNQAGTQVTRSSYHDLNSRAMAIAVDRTHGVYVTGLTSSAGFFTTPGAFQSAPRGLGKTAFVARLDLSAGPVELPESSVVNAASLLPGPVAPGEIITIFGQGFGPDELKPAQLDAAGRLETALAETRVLFQGVPAPLLYVAKNQVSAVVPYWHDFTLLAEVHVEYRGVLSSAVSLFVAPSSPAIFTQDSSGKGPGAILNQDMSPNTADNPAAAGSVVVIYATGAGQTEPPGVDGAIAAEPLSKPVLPVSVIIGGRAAEVLYAGAAPGMVAGVLQVNARIPAGVAADPAVPIFLKIGDDTSPAGVTLAIHP